MLNKPDYVNFHNLGLYAKLPMNRISITRFHEGKTPWPVWDGGEQLAEKSEEYKENVLATTLFQMKKRLGHLDRKIELLKIDCEGCEMDSALDIFHTGRNNFDK